jgi:hypothetical protein
MPGSLVWLAGPDRTVSAALAGYESSFAVRCARSDIARSAAELVVALTGNSGLDRDQCENP